MLESTQLAGVRSQISIQSKKEDHGVQNAPKSESSGHSMTLSGCGEKNGSFGGKLQCQGLRSGTLKAKLFFWLAPPRLPTKANVSGLLLIHKHFPWFSCPKSPRSFFSLTQHELQDTPKSRCNIFKDQKWLKQIIFVHLCVSTFSVPTSMALPGATRTVGNEVILHRLLLPEFRWATSLKCSLYPIVSNCARGVGWSR